MKVSVLTDNIVNRRDLLAEHGLSLFIEFEDIRILFDTGQTSVYRHNAAAMGIDLKNTDCIVLSHGHYDHCGGLVHFPKTDAFPKLYAHPQAFCKRYKANLLTKDYTDIGIPWRLSDYSDIQSSLIWNRNMLNPYPRVHLITEISGSTDFEDIPAGFLTDQSGHMEPDMFLDEQALVIETDKGLAVFLGCSHPGVISCLQHIKRCFPDQNIYALFAGMHMGGAGPARIQRTIQHIADYQIQKVVPLHCTGMMAICEMKRILGERCLIRIVGDTVDI